MSLNCSSHRVAVKLSLSSGLHQMFHRNCQSFAIGRFRLSNFHFSVQFSQGVTFLSKSLLLLMDVLDIPERSIGSTTISVFILAGRRRTCVSWPRYCKPHHCTCRSVVVLYEKCIVWKIPFCGWSLALPRMGRMRDIASYLCQTKTSRIFPWVLHAWDLWQFPTSTLGMDN